MSRRDIIAAGAVVWRLNGRKVEVLLVHRPDYNDWSIPKGKLDNGEDIQAAAVREVEEETGVPIVLGQPLGTVSYKNGGGRRKIIQYWAARPVAEQADILSPRPKVAPAKKTEIDDARWVPSAIAFTLLDHESDKDLLGKVLDQYADDKLDTQTILIARHSRAKKRSSWKGGKGGESTRPLTPAGMKQSKALIPFLASYGITRIISSPWERCTATVAPYAAALGTEIETRDELTETAHEKKPRPVHRLIDQLLKKADEPTVVCMHRPTLGTAMDAVRARVPYAILKKVPASDPWLRTGEVLVAHVARPTGRRVRVVALETIRPARPA